MLSKFIVQIYTTLIEILLWLLSILGFIIGGLSHSTFFNPTHGVIGLVITFVVCSIVFGGLLIIIDIRSLLITLNESSKKV